MKRIVLFILVFLAVLSMISLILSIWLGLAQGFRVVFGVIYVMFVPGFVWSYVFFASADSTLITNADKTLIKNPEEKKRDAIDGIERITLSIALSLALVPLTIFFLNKIGLKINLLNTVLEILGIIIIGLILLIIMPKLKLKIKK